MALQESLRTTFLAAMDELQRVLAAGEHAELLDEHAQAEGLLEARDAQIAAQAELLSEFEVPLLQVRRTTLCVPLIGECDPYRTGEIIQRLLKAAIERGVTTVVIDLTGAVFRDPSTAVDLARVFQSLRLVGVRGVLSGVQPTLAPALAGMHGALRDVPCYADLAAALAADEGRRGA
jgi:rsbT co-antagonist protein RsbR